MLHDHGACCSSRKFASTLMREYSSASAGIFVTLSDFTGQARVAISRRDYRD